MNFNFPLLIVIMFISASCGVKSAPAVPKDDPIPSYVDQFTQRPTPVKKDNN